jgi:hypothetical protein
VNDTNCHSYREALERLIDGDIEDSGLGPLRVHVETCPSCRDDYEWVRQVSADLESMADELVSDAPEIDIIAAVMSQVQSVFRGPDTVVPFIKPKEQPRAFPWKWVAAAAAVIVAGWLAFAPGFSEDEDRPAERIARPPAPEPSNDEPGEVVPPVEVAANETPLRQTQPIPIYIFPERQPDDPPDSGGKSLTRDEVTQTFAASLTADNLDGMERLLALAEINREQAAEILANVDASQEARIAAAQIVDGPEGAQALFEAVGRDPDSSYLRAQLAQSYSGNPATEAQALEQTTKLRDQDPGNAYWAYLDAERLFGMGEIEAGLESLRVASEMESLTTYPLEGALNREQYMIESGIDPELAHLLSSLTAGVLEMNDISMLATSLIGYGDAAREDGDEESAEIIFEFVANLGMQVDNGAILAQERNTAAVVTEVATGYLETLSTFLDDPETVEQLLGVANSIVSDVSEYFDSLTETLLSDAVSGATPEVQDPLWRYIADSIFADGDLTLVDAIGEYLQP